MICTKYLEMYESLTAGYILMWKQTLLEAVAAMLLRSSSIMWCKQCMLVTVKVPRDNYWLSYSFDRSQILKNKNHNTSRQTPRILIASSPSWNEEGYSIPFHIFLINKNYISQCWGSFKFSIIRSLWRMTNRIYSNFLSDNSIVDFSIGLRFLYLFRFVFCNWNVSKLPF